MTPELLFSIVNIAPLPFWFLMIFLPGWSVTRRVMETHLAPGLFAVVYAILILPALPMILPMFASPPNLDTIRAELTKPEGFVVAWVHYLAFDLFVGRWIYLDSRERGGSVWLTGPCLFLTLMLGPLGYLCYWVVRQITPNRPKS
jgi:apolipoprotein N-acyltransferase